MQIYDVDCPNEEQNCRIAYDGSQDNIHIFSSITAGGEDICWNYHNNVFNCEMTLTAFCSSMDTRYPTGVKFMSRQTFTEFIFSWMANFKKDPRKFFETIEKPTAFACDGTKIGAPLRFAQFSPIETPTSETKVDNKHTRTTRTQRQYFNYKLSDSKDTKQCAAKCQEYTKHPG